MSQTLSSQLSHFFQLQTERSLHHVATPADKAQLAKLFAWSEQFAAEYMKSRQARAADVNTDATRRAQELAFAYIGKHNHDFFVTCVDGRNMPAVMFSRPPHVGGVLRSPAGAVTGFMAGQKPGSVFIDEDSFVVQQIIRLLVEKQGDTIFYGLDSHLACAARGLIHSTEGGLEQDSGLRSDVKTKFVTAQGIVQLRQQLALTNPAIAEIVPTFFSYDPHSGGVLTGLEIHVDADRVVATGFTDEVLAELAAEGSIVRTIDLLQRADVQSELARAIPARSADFRRDFAQSMLRNWQAITEVFAGGKGYVYQTIYSQLIFAYENGGWQCGTTDDLSNKIISHRTLKQKAKFLLKNLVTRYSLAGADHEWPFEQHQEELTVITDGGYAPFVNPDMDAFAVFSRDLNALLPNTKLTIDLIRQFRRSQAINDPMVNSQLSPEEFVAAPVLISNKAILRVSQADSWSALSRVDLTALAEINWDDQAVLNWQRANVEKLLAAAMTRQAVVMDVHDALAFVEVIYELFDRLRIMMRDKYFRQMIIHGSIVMLYTIVDADRGPRFIVPFAI